MQKHSAILLIGSNIEPEINILQALDLLAERARVIARSRIWETKAVGSNGPNFLNIAVHIETDLEPDEIKSTLIHPIENQLGRVRSEDKNMPRTMDIDTIFYDGQVIDENLWTKAFIALPVAELVPDLPHPATNQPLSEVSARLKNSAFAELFNSTKNTI
jgi:2-amino-4-hydroxy-6-hydroxymethyldihydropteridine diphosphokinase